MPPKSSNWSPEQIAFVMEQTAAGVKPAEIGKAVKKRWPDREVGKNAISGLINRQNKKKSSTQGKGQSSRETSAVPSMPARSGISESFKPTANSPHVPETPQQRPISPVQKFITPNTSPKILPFSSFKTPPPASSTPATSNPESSFGQDSGHRSHKKKVSFVSAPRELPDFPDAVQKETRRPSAAAYLERLVSLSPGKGGINTDFNRLSESPTKEATKSPDTVLNFESMVAKGLVKNYDPTAFFKAGCSASSNPQRSPSDDSFDFKDSVNDSSSSHGAVTEEPILYSPRPSTELPKQVIELKEPFPEFDNATANRLLEDITPAPSPILYDPEIADSLFESDACAENNEQEVEEDLVQSVETADSAEVKSEIAVAEEIDVEFGAEDIHQVQTKVSVNEEVEIEVANIAEPIQEIQIEVAAIEEIETEVETDLAEPAHAIEEVNSTPVSSPKSTTPDLDITPRASQQPTFPEPRQPSPAVNMAVQIAPPSAPAPTPIPTATPIKMPNFFEELGSEIITLYVGPKRKEFPIHGNLLRLKSNFFKEFVVATTDSNQAEHYLPESDPDAVGLIINWLYRQGISLIPGLPSTGSVSLIKGTDEHSNFTKAISRTIEVYILAEKLDMDELMDLVMTELGNAYYRYQTYPSPQDITAVYNRSASGSRLRKYMARSYQVLADLEDGDLEGAGWTAEEVDEVVSEVPALFKDFRALNRKSKGVESTEQSLDLV
ncbi:hypothetical protein DL95DRAFT_404682 [Leptodontidium sp. 2 PMI_412]|nr:hypothetical protein DL95DRAFT_404682 [Leptodontidium sp. 2 PMI_412]